MDNAKLLRDFLTHKYTTTMQKFFLITLFLFSFGLQKSIGQDTAAINKSWSYVKKKFNIEAQGVINLSKILADSTTENKDFLKKASNEATNLSKHLASYSQVTKPLLDETQQMLVQLDATAVSVKALFQKYPKLERRKIVQDQIAILTGNKATFTFVLRGYNDVCKDNKQMDLMFTRK